MGRPSKHDLTKRAISRNVVFDSDRESTAVTQDDKIRDVVLELPKHKKDGYKNFKVCIPSQKSINFSSTDNNHRIIFPDGNKQGGAMAQPQRKRRSGSRGSAKCNRHRKSRRGKGKSIGLRKVRAKSAGKRARRTCGKKSRASRAKKSLPIKTSKFQCFKKLGLRHANRKPKRSGRKSRTARVCKSRRGRAKSQSCRTTKKRSSSVKTKCAKSKRGVSRGRKPRSKSAKLGSDDTEKRGKKSVAGNKGIKRSRSRSQSVKRRSRSSVGKKSSGRRATSKYANDECICEPPKKRRKPRSKVSTTSYKR